MSNPINAIYTPFSFLLVYEAYLLLYYLPQSPSIYIVKQYEIITLILIRGVFKDITHLDLGNAGGIDRFYRELWYDLATVIIVFGLIFIFYKISNRYALQTINPASGAAENSAVHPVQEEILSDPFAHLHNAGGLLLHSLDLGCIGEP